MRSKILQLKTLESLLIPLLVLAFAGIGLSVLSTMHHIELLKYGSTSSYCNINQIFDCDAVARSPFSELFGVPTGVFGIGYFISLVVLLSLRLRPHSRLKEFSQVLQLLYPLGLLVAITMASLSFFVVGRACLTCMGLYLVLSLQWCVFSFSEQAWAKAMPDSNWVKGLASVGLIMSGGPTVYLTALKPVPFASADYWAGTKLAMQKEADLPLSPEVKEIPIARGGTGAHDEDYRLGPDGAKVVIVEFADFRCPGCRSAHNSLKAILKGMAGRIQFVFKNFPLDQECHAGLSGQIHPLSCEAARLARCVGQKGRFFEFHDRLFDRQNQISKEELKSWAKEFGLNDGDYTKCLADQNVLAKIKADIELGDRIGVNSTPTVFINGRKLKVPLHDPSLKEALVRMLSD